MIDGSSLPVSGQSSAELPPADSSGGFGYDVVCNILERLITEHLRRDENWEPSGRYNMAAGQRGSLVHVSIISSQSSVSMMNFLKE